MIEQTTHSLRRIQISATELVAIIAIVFKKGTQRTLQYSRHETFLSMMANVCYSIKYNAVTMMYIFKQSGTSNLKENITILSTNWCTFPIAKDV